MALIPQIIGFLDVPKLFPLQPKPPQEQTDCSHPPLLASQNPDMPLSFTRWRTIRLLLLYYLGLLPFVPIPEKFLLCFLPTIINRCPQGPPPLLHPPPGCQLLLSLEKHPTPHPKPHFVTTFPVTPTHSTLKTRVLTQHPLNTKRTVNPVKFYANALGCRCGWGFGTKGSCACPFTQLVFIECLLCSRCSHTSNQAGWVGQGPPFTVWLGRHVLMTASL